MASRPDTIINSQNAYQDSHAGTELGPVLDTMAYICKKVVAVGVENVSDLRPRP